MELKEALSARYSCRKYADKAVEREKLIMCARAGRIAPSACNSQRWAFVIVEEDNVKEQIAKSLYDEKMHVNTFAYQIPAFIVVVKHPPRNPNEKQKKLLSHSDWTLMDIGIAAENICLQATDLGLGSIMLGWFKEDIIRSAINLPEHLSVGVVIGLGYPLAPPAGRTGRLPEEDIILFDKYCK